jgi:hypothetical protein
MTVITDTIADWTRVFDSLSDHISMTLRPCASVRPSK